MATEGRGQFVGGLSANLAYWLLCYGVFDLG